MPQQQPIPTATLYNGHVIPLIGLGCASGVREEHVTNALNIGYTFFDTAQSYNWGYHEDEVGTAISNYRNSLNQKQQNENEIDNDNVDGIFIQTKIHPEDLGYDATKKAIANSLKRLNVSKIDSVLIHKPHCWGDVCSRKPEGTWQDSWKVLEEFYLDGIITKSIGICDVSNEKLLNELLTQKIKPHIIQNWFDPLHQDTYMRQKIQSYGIIYQAYSSLGSQWKYRQGYKSMNNPVLNHPTLKRIAMNHNHNHNQPPPQEAEVVDVDISQIIINWATIHKNVSILPASTNTIHQKNNLYNAFSFKLTEKEIQEIDSLDGTAEKEKEESSIRSNNNQQEVTIKFDIDPTSFVLQEPIITIIDIYWIDTGHDDGDGDGDGDGVHVGSVRGVGGSGDGDGDGNVNDKTTTTTLTLNTFYDHVFRFIINNNENNHDNDGNNDNDNVIYYEDYTIQRNNGPSQVYFIKPTSNTASSSDDEEL